MHRITLRLAPNLAPIVITIDIQKGNDLCTHFQCPLIFLKVTMHTLVMDGNLQIMKLNFFFVKFVSLNCDNYLKLNTVLGRFRKGMELVSQ